MQELKPREVYRAFQMHPTQIYQLTTRGVLPLRPRGCITQEFLESLVKWFSVTRGPLPPAVRALMSQMNLKVTGEA